MALAIASRIVDRPLRFPGVVTLDTGHFDPKSGRFDIRERSVTHNALTDHGDLAYAKLVTGTAQPIVTGMRYGTGTTGVTKSGTGSFIQTYVAASSRALDSAPVAATIGAGGSGATATYVVTWPSGTAPSVAITEMVLTDIAIADVVGAAGNTIARTLLSTPRDNTGLALRATWVQTILG